MIRRSFLTSLGAGVTLAQVGVNSGWQPGRHDLDDWLDKVPGKHRLVFDTTTPEGAGGAMLYANNFYIANQSGYGLQNSDLAVVIVVRHNSTPFAFNDAIWAKYGSTIAAQTNNFTDPKTKQPPAANLFNASGYGPALTNAGVTLDSLLKRGLHLAVCQMATRRLAGGIATATGGTVDAIYNELIANLVTNSHPVPAGIVAVNRAQERGYSFVHA